MTALKDTFTSTGHKLTWHTKAMQGLRDGTPQAITCHLMPTDRCAHRCAFCSVGQRSGDVLPLRVMQHFVGVLLKYRLKSVIVSGGGNPILYRCPETGANFNDLIDWLHGQWNYDGQQLQIGVISDGMPLKRFEYTVWDDDCYAVNLCPPTPDGRRSCPKCHSDTSHWSTCPDFTPVEWPKRIRESWGCVHPKTLDKLAWLRISMAGLDHEENEVFVPDIDPAKTTLGFSYVAHDVFFDHAEKHHGRVSTELDIVGDRSQVKEWRFADRIEKLTEQWTHYCSVYKPRYLRALPNCLQPDMIADRCRTLQGMCDKVNDAVGKPVAFVQYKPPEAPKSCFLGYVHPVLAPDGLVYPCDSVTLAVADVAYRQGKSDHRFASPWAICRWDEVENMFTSPVRSLIADTQGMCKGCVFSRQNEILGGVVDGTADLTPPAERPEHENFI